MNGASILIIDDEQSYLDVITETLKHKEFNVLIALNGQMGCMVAQKFLPDIIICDWEMPVMNGIETIKKIKETEKTRDIPIIMATGIMTSSENLEMALEAGAVDFIRKPIDSIELTARINSVIKLAKSLKEIKIQRDQLKELNATKDKFFSIIAHDLRGPFNNIIGFSGLLQDYYHDYNDDQKEDMISMLNTSARTAYKLLENLLEWARTQSNQISFEPVTLNLNKIIDNCVNEINGMASNKEIKIFVEQTEKITIFGDKNLISFVIRNLLANAVKFTHRKGQITISTETKQNFLEISVSDTGVGISQKNIDKLFRIDDKYLMRGTEGEPTTGLGLILCREFVEKQGGKIWVKSQLNSGSIFTFSLPLSNEEQG